MITMAHNTTNRAGQDRKTRQSNTRRALRTFVMLANASIQNTTTLQNLPLCADFNELPGSSHHFVVSPRLDPRFRGDDKCWQLFRAVSRARRLDRIADRRRDWIARSAAQRDIPGPHLREEARSGD
ncbi:MAG: hypothetical protein WAV18_30020, partial [Roseiarcus sp.]